MTAPGAVRVGALVAAAGAGHRLGMGSKALVEVGGRSVLGRALRLFLELAEVDQVAVVGPEALLDRVRAEVARLPATKPVTVGAGGGTRQQSVRAGLAQLGGCTHVLVHDAARCMATPALARRVLGAAIETGAAIPGLPPRDAVKRVEAGRLVESLDRSRLVLAQTPQGFSLPLLVRAHFEAADAGLGADDDAQLVQAIGHPVAVVAGEASNIKLTTVEDLELMEALAREQAVR